ncbi:MAG: hypothetical protein J3K34DRAFT_478297, partial [Monoraphidium minutum]
KAISVQPFALAPFTAPPPRDTTPRAPSFVCLVQMGLSERNSFFSNSMSRFTGQRAPQGQRSPAQAHAAATPAPRSHGAAALLDWSIPKTESPFKEYEAQADANRRRRDEETARVSGPPVLCYGADGDRSMYDLATHNRLVVARPFVPATAPDAARSFQEPSTPAPAPAAAPAAPVTLAAMTAAAPKAASAARAAGAAQPAPAAAVVAAASPSIIISNSSPKPATISAAIPAKPISCAAPAGRKTAIAIAAAPRGRDKRRAIRASKQQRDEAKRADRQQQAANKLSQGAAAGAAAAAGQGPTVIAAAAIAIDPVPFPVPTATAAAAAEQILLLQRQLAAAQARERGLVKGLAAARATAAKEAAARATAEAAASAAHNMAAAAVHKLARAKVSFAKSVAKLQQQVAAGAAEVADLCGALALAAQQMQQQEQHLKHKQPKAARLVKGEAPLPPPCPKPKAAARLLAAAVGKAKRQGRRRSPAGPKGRRGARAEGGAPAGPLLMRDDSAREREGAAGRGSGSKECKQHAQQITEQEHTACGGECGGAAASLLPASGGGGGGTKGSGGAPSFCLEVACFDDADCWGVAPGGSSEGGGVPVVVGAVGVARGPMWGPQALLRCLRAVGERVGATYTLGLLRALGLSAGGA